MDDLEFTISASGDFGNFMWEYPDDIKALFQKLQELAGEESVRGVMEEQKKNILVLLYIQLGVIQAGSLAPILAENTAKRLYELAEEGLKLIQSHRS